MRPLALLAALGLGGLTAPAAHASATDARPTVHHVATHSSPATDKRRIGGAHRGASINSGAFASGVWSGYVATNAGAGNTSVFNSVSAQWKVQPVTCDPTAADSQLTVSWVGFDGWLNSSVEQAGTIAVCNFGQSQPQYSAWWEMFPFNSIQFSFAVNAGDTIEASATFNTSTSMFDLSVQDVTSSQSLNQVVACQADQAGCVRSSAEVITEDPEGGNDIDGTFFLADYGTQAYSNASMTSVAGHTGTFSDPAWTNDSVTEISSQGVTKQTVSALSPDGSSFSTTWQHETSSNGSLPTMSDLYETFSTSATTNTITPVIELVDSGTVTAWPLENVTIRYWFTEDGTDPMSFACDSAAIGCSNITGQIVPVSPAVTGADHYFQIGFFSSAGSMGPGNLGVMQFRLFKTNFTNMTQTNDHSFNASDTSFTANPKITIYYNGTLIYGTEPK